MTAGADSRPATGRAETVDAFHFGAFYLVQPKGQGHRAGSDAMFLAALVPDDATGKLADLGAGSGAAGMAAAARIPGLCVTLVERSPDMADYARRSVDLEANGHLKPRVNVIEADVTLTGKARIAAGLGDAAYDHVIMNPPFNLPTDRKTPDALKAEAHAMQAEMFDKWLRTANAIARPGGQLSLIARPQSIAEILAACENRFGGIRITPVHPRRNADATRLLITGIKGSRARMEFGPALIVHDDTGHRFSEQAAALNNGRACLRRDA